MEKKIDLNISMKKEYVRPPFGFPIPDILEESIMTLLKAVDDGKDFIDCEQDDVYGSANMAFSSNCITEEQARWIQKYYSDGGMFRDK